MKRKPLVWISPSRSLWACALRLITAILLSFCNFFLSQAKQPSKWIFLFLKVVLIQMQETSIQLLGVMMGAAFIHSKSFLGIWWNEKHFQRMLDKQLWWYCCLNGLLASSFVLQLTYLFQRCVLFQWQWPLIANEN
jgi:hypothetical protein